jgi:hypothetical protein
MTVSLQHPDRVTAILIQTQCVVTSPARHHFTRGRYRVDHRIDFFWAGAARGARACAARDPTYGLNDMFGSSVGAQKKSKAKSFDIRCYYWRWL